MKRTIFRWIKIIVLVYSLIGIAMYYLQDVILFHPEKIPRTQPYHFSEKFKEIDIPLNGTDTMNLVKFFPAAAAKGVVLYFHGNKQNIARYAPYAKIFTDAGYEVWMPDYPGFGKSTGEMTENKLYSQALQLQKMAAAVYHADSIIVYGKSLGTGIAAYVASVSSCRQLILETPYYSIPAIFGSYAFMYPVERMIRYKIPTHQFLGEVGVPVTIFHGTGDWIIPYRCASRLKAVLKHKDQFITIKGASHNDLNKTPEYKKAMDSLLL